MTALDLRFYVDCSCEHHNVWKKFSSEAEAKAYFISLSFCPKKILYTETNDPEKPLFKLQES